MPSAINPAQIEQHKTLVTPLHRVFANLAFSYGMTAKEAERGELSGSALDCLEAQCESLKALTESVRQALRGGV